MVMVMMMMMILGLSLSVVTFCGTALAFFGSRFGRPGPVSRSSWRRPGALRRCARAREGGREREGGEGGREGRGRKGGRRGRIFPDVEALWVRNLRGLVFQCSRCRFHLRGFRLGQGSCAVSASSFSQVARCLGFCVILQGLAVW